jgi:peptidyl-prolyl cis-trans isomerase C
MAWAALFCTLLAGGLAGAPASAADALSPDSPVASVDGSPITVADIRIALQFVPPEYRSLPAEFLLDTLVNQVIDVKLMAKAALASPSPDQDGVEREVTFFRERLLRQRYLQGLAASAITEAELKKTYEAQVKAMPPEEETKAHHILVKTEEEAKAIVEALDKGGDFEALAKEKSIDTGSAPKGGDLGYFRKSAMVAPFAEAAFATEIGKYSVPVKTDYGWHIIRVDDRRPAEPPKFEQMQSELREVALSALVARAAKDLRANAKIEINQVEPAQVIGPPAAAPGAAAQ